MSAATLVRDHLAPDGVRELHPAGSDRAMRKWVSQHMRRWSHTCPDGTPVEVTAQFISVTGVTLYRWTIDGRPTCPSSARRPIDEEPDWTCCQSVPDPTTTQEEPTMSPVQEQRRPASQTVVIPARAAATSTAAVVEAPPPASALSIATGQEFWTDYQRAALVQLGVDEAPNADLAIYLNQCQRTGLDPFARQIYMIGRRDGGRKKWTIQTSIDGFRLIADRTGLYEGQTPQEWCGPDGVWRDVWTESVPPVAARVGVHRRGWREPVYAVAAWREYAVYRKENGVQVLGSFWKRMSSHMLSKVAEALALRKAFPQDLSGLYTTDELDRLNTEGGEVAPEVAPIPTQQDRAQHDQYDYPRGTTSVSDAADAVADAAATYDGPVEEPPLDWDAAIDEAVRIPDVANSVAALKALYGDAVAANRAGRCPNEVVHRIMDEGESARLHLARMSPAGA